MRLLRAYSAERLEAACHHALEIGTLNHRSVKSILATGRDQTAAAEQHTLSLPAQHAHIRGPEYYTNSQNGKESDDHASPAHPRRLRRRKPRRLSLEVSRA